jgi:acyl-CoA-binding protein
MESAMADLKAEFEQAQREVKTLTRRPSDDDLLALYAAFKQGSQGDVSGSRPGLLNLKGRAKYDAWAKLKGTGRDEAMKKYLDKAAALLKSHK